MIILIAPEARFSTIRPSNATDGMIVAEYKIYFGSGRITSNRRSESFPMVPFAPSNSHEHSVWGLRPDPRDP